MAERGKQSVPSAVTRRVDFGHPSALKPTGERIRRYWRGTVRLNWTLNVYGHAGRDEKARAVAAIQAPRALDQRTSNRKARAMLG
jgi:hypothetical protein